MPTLTIALFGLALVILGAALAVSFLAGGDDDNNTPAGQVGVNQTNTALAQTPNTASSTTPRPSTTTGANTTPGANTTTTPGAGQTPGAGAGTYTVESGDFCGTIADANNLSLDQFIALNPGIACENLQIGQVVKVR